jgi:hypothetical protein
MVLIIQMGQFEERKEKHTAYIYAIFTSVVNANLTPIGAETPIDI